MGVVSFSVGYYFNVMLRLAIGFPAGVQTMKSRLIAVQKCLHDVEIGFGAVGEPNTWESLAIFVADVDYRPPRLLVTDAVDYYVEAQNVFRVVADLFQKLILVRLDRVHS